MRVMVFLVVLGMGAVMRFASEWVWWLDVIYIASAAFFAAWAVRRERDQ